jgi:hypothetical protein
MNDWGPLKMPATTASTVHLDRAFLHTSSDACTDVTKKKQTHTINPKTTIFIFDLLSPLTKQKTYHGIF